MMPRGRAGLCYITPESVARVLLDGSYRERVRRVKQAAGYFGVDERTVRRWLKRGVTLFYGDFGIQPEQWERFAKTLRVSVNLQRHGQLFADPLAPVRAPAGGQVAIDTCPRSSVDRRRRRA